MHLRNLKIAVLYRGIVLLTEDWAGVSLAFSEPVLAGVFFWPLTPSAAPRLTAASCDAALLVLSLGLVSLVLLAGAVEAVLSATPLAVPRGAASRLPRAPPRGLELRI